jgi:beta-aspartyl-peptidase (threonine type)
VVERELRRWEAWREGRTLDAPETVESSTADTVGAVAMDARGNIAAGDSTGGRSFKHPGRVGDSPLIGCGIYADNRVGGAACTGWGEDIIRMVLAKTAIDLLKGGRSAQEAASMAVTLLREGVDGHGGVIMIDHAGTVGYSFNTAAMAYAYLTEGMRDPVVGV